MRVSAVTVVVSERAVLLLAAEHLVVGAPNALVLRLALIRTGDPVLAEPAVRLLVLVLADDSILAAGGVYRGPREQHGFEERR